jgi:hypothetical protein
MWQMVAAGIARKARRRSALGNVHWQNLGCVGTNDAIESTQASQAAPTDMYESSMYALHVRHTLTQDTNI